MLQLGPEGSSAGGSGLGPGAQAEGGRGGKGLLRKAELAAVARIPPPPPPPRPGASRFPAPGPPVSRKGQARADSQWLPSPVLQSLLRMRGAENLSPSPGPPARRSLGLAQPPAGTAGPWRTHLVGQLLGEGGRGGGGSAQGRQRPGEACCGI